MTFDGVTLKYAGGRFLMNHRVHSVASLKESTNPEPTFEGVVTMGRDSTERLITLMYVGIGRGAWRIGLE